MHTNTSKQNPVASDVYHLRSGDKRKQKQMKNIKRQKLENIHQRNISSCTNTGDHDFIKLNKQNTQQITDLVKPGEIYLYTVPTSLDFPIFLQFSNKTLDIPR